jgi:hypothetical protein
VDDPLHDGNYVTWCAKRYHNPHLANDEDFYEDLSRVRYIKKLLTRFTETGELRERLIMNHVIVLANSFGPAATCKILFLKLHPAQRPLIKPFLTALSILPDVVRSVGSAGDIDTREIVSDARVVGRIAENVRC